MISLNVNGKPVQADADGDTPLLWVLRDHLDLTGTKFGCGMALCGACTVHVDGEPTRSLRDAGVRRRRQGDHDHRRRSATPAPARRCRRRGSQQNVPQCGYCQSGQVMAATALLASKPSADRRGHRRRDERQHLPLRHLPAHPRRDQAAPRRR